jgi:pyrophosphatase PpaX
MQREGLNVIQTVLFDLDGTLINTNRLILASFQYTLDRYFPGQYTKEDLIPFIGEPLHASFSRVDARLAGEMVAVYREYNSRHHDQLVTEFPGVHETLQNLRKAGCHLGVVSTKRRDMVERGLTLTHMNDYFSTIVAGDEVGHFKPDPEPVETAIARLHATAEQTMMVGDSPADILAGSSAHVRTAAVSWSLKERSVLEGLHPDYFLDSMIDLLDIVRREDSAAM